MVLDSSALVAILQDEPERRAFNERIEAAAEVRISAANLLEARIVLFTRFGESAVQALDAFLLRARIIVVEVSPRDAELAFDAYRRYGKGTGHPAGLNYGDCFAYALAKRSAASLLFKGRDFALTDLPAATAGAL